MRKYSKDTIGRLIEKSLIIKIALTSDTVNRTTNDVDYELNKLN